MPQRSLRCLRDWWQEETHMLKPERIVLAVTLTFTGGIAVVAQQPAGTPQPSPEHKKLAAFVGTWKDEAEMKPGFFGPGGKMNLTETCEWFTGGFSVVCHTDATGFMGDLKTLTVLTYDSEEKVYRFHEFNSAGWSDVAKGTVEGDTWTFDGESTMGGKAIKSRSTIKMPSPDFAQMRSEMSVDGGPMTLWMELKGARVKENQRGFNSCMPHASEGWVFECFRTWLGSLPFQLSNDFLIVVEGRIGSLSTLKFLLDTGTTHTMVDERIATRLSLKRQSGKVLNFDRFARIEWAKVPEIELGPLTARDLPVMVGKLAHYSELADGVDAIIGLDLLSASESLKIDYSTKQITIRTSAQRGEQKTAPQALTGQLSLQGQPARLVIDTGVQSMLLYKDRIRKHLPQLRFDDKPSHVCMGKLAGERATLSGVRVGANELRTPVFLISGAPGSLSADIDGYVGTSVLGARVIELDFASNTLRWQ
jgi:hypothetical protein